MDAKQPIVGGAEQRGCDLEANRGLQAHTARCTVHRAGHTSSSLRTALPVGLPTQAAIHPPTPEMPNI